MGAILCVTVIVMCNDSERDTTQRLTPIKLACIATLACLQSRRTVCNFLLVLQNKSTEHILPVISVMFLNKSRCERRFRSGVCHIFW